MDFNQTAKRVVDTATGQGDEREPALAPKPKAQGGKARASALSAERRSEIARQAARARWAKAGAA